MGAGVSPLASEAEDGGGPCLAGGSRALGVAGVGKEECSGVAGLEGTLLLNKGTRKHWRDDDSK